MSTVTKAIRETDGERAERILAALIERPAQQSDLFEREPEVQSYLAETVTQEAEGLGLGTEQDDIGNVLIRVGRQDGMRKVAIFAYAMTHPAGRMVDAHRPSVVLDHRGRRVRGRGAAEQKGSLVAALLSMARLREREDELDGSAVLCVSAAGETGRHDAARAFLEAAGTRTFDWCIVSIGTNSQICVANKGRVDVEITVRGRSAHSSTPWGGLNAIAGAREVLRRLDEVPLPGMHPVLKGPTLTPTAIHSYPSATHTIPDEVRIVLDRRLLPGDLPDPALEDIRRAVERLDSFDVAVEAGPYMYPAEVSPASSFVRSLERAFGALDYPVPDLRYSHGAIDAGFFNHRGIPSVMFGPGEQEMWHTDDESVLIDDVLVCASVYATTALNHLTEARDL